KDARARGDAERLRLARIRFEAGACVKSNPRKAVALCEQGRQLARKLVEPWWQLFYAQAKFHAVMSAREALQLAVEIVLEVRKPLFKDYPLRFGAFVQLIAAYINVDPVGYAPEIRAAIGGLGADADCHGRNSIV